MTAAHTGALVAVLAAIAAPARGAIGGPDAFGYTWCDSDEPGNTAAVPAFVPEDLRARGFQGDDVVLSVDLPPAAFPSGFPYYGVRYARVWLSSNGWLSFLDPAANSAPVAGRIPGMAMPNALVAFLWDDLTLEAAAPRAEGGTNLALDGYTLSLRVASKRKPGMEADLFLTLFNDGCIKLVYRGDVVAMKDVVEIGIESAPGDVGMPYMQTGSALNGANFRSDYAVYFSVAWSCCGRGCVTEAQPPRLGNVLLGVRSGRDSIFRWTPPLFDGRGFRFYLDGDPRLPSISRALVDEVSLAAPPVTDSLALDHPPVPLGFYQVVGVSCLGSLESPY